MNDAANSLNRRAAIMLAMVAGITTLLVAKPAITLHQSVYGMLLLVSAFSLGLASVLIVIELSVVYARQWLDCHAETLRERLPSRGNFLQHLPTASSIAVIFVGAVLIACAVA